jgi:ATP-binding cassette, subfamily B, bacterial
MRVKKLLKIGKGLYALMMIAIFLAIINQFTYSTVPLFTQYLMKTLLEQPNIGDPTVVLSDVNLPNFVIRFFELTPDLMAQITRIALGLVLLQTFRFSLRFFELYLRGYIQQNMSQKLRLKMYQHIQDLSYKFHNKADSGDLIQRATSDVETTTRFLSATLMEVVFLLSTLVFGAYQLYLINTTIVIFMLSILPFVAASSIWYFKKNDQLYEHIEKTESSMMTVIQENLSGARIVRAFGNEAYEVEKMQQKNSAHKEAVVTTGKVIAKYWGFMDFIGIAQYAVVILIGVIDMNRGLMDAPQIVASLGLVGMLIWPIRGLGRILNDFTKALVASDRIDEILSQKTEYDQDGTLVPDIKGHIEFQDVSFKFDDTDQHLLKNISFDIKPGETVAFIGRTGSGKTTIMNLLMRMYDYASGSIKIDDVELKDIKKQHIRQHLGVVLQEPFLFSKSVYENIAISNQKANRDQVTKAAQIASLERDIKTFKQGYETLVGEKGTTLSGGQKQRVAIARILVSEKPILIFDDALSAVDTETDMMIREALKKNTNTQTTLIITHRITTAKEADKIIVLKDGLIEAIGTHETLIQQQGLYLKLWQIQGKLEQEFLDTLSGGDSHA